MIQLKTKDDIIAALKQEIEDATRKRDEEIGKNACLEAKIEGMQRYHDSNMRLAH